MSLNGLPMEDDTYAADTVSLVNDEPVEQFAIIQIPQHIQQLLTRGQLQTTTKHIIKELHAFLILNKQFQFVCKIYKRLFGIILLKLITILSTIQSSCIPISAQIVPFLGWHIKDEFLVAVWRFSCRGHQPQPGRRLLTDDLQGPEPHTEYWLDLVTELWIIL